jgi:hypothetical protein
MGRVWTFQRLLHQWEVATHLEGRTKQDGLEDYLAPHPLGQSLNTLAGEIGVRRGEIEKKFNRLGHGRISFKVYSWMPGSSPGMTDLSVDPSLPGLTRQSMPSFPHPSAIARAMTMRWTSLVPS